MNCRLNCENEKGKSISREASINAVLVRDEHEIVKKKSMLLAVKGIAACIHLKLITYSVVSEFIEKFMIIVFAEKVFPFYSPSKPLLMHEHFNRKIMDLVLI
jgi:hypothetical protein